MYRTYNARPLPQRHVRRRSRTPLVAALAVAVLLIGAYLGFALLRPLPGARLTITPPVTPALVKVSIPWPAATPQEQSAFGAIDYGLLAQSSPASSEKPLPMASVAKTITALTVLDKKPLKPGEQGPSITLTARDVEIYNEYIAKDGSVVPISAGQIMTEYQALQALMLPSANNIADTLAMWAYGDMPAYTAAANSYAKKIGMAKTTVADASGFAPATAGTAADLVKLGLAAMEHPVLSEIVGQKTAEFPGYGTIRNVNSLLGQSGVRGIKTGNTDEAGGVFLGAADVTIGSKKITVITAIMGSPDRPQALRETLPLVLSAPAQFQNVRAVRAGQAVGKATTVWGASSKITAAEDISVVAWTGTAIASSGSTTGATVPAKAGTDVGDLVLKFNGTSQKSDLELGEALGKPSLWWRLLHPVN